MPPPGTDAAVEAVAAAASQIEPHAKLLVRLAQLAWHKLTQQSAFSTEDRARYDKLVDLYKQYKLADKPPDEWALDEHGCPQFYQSFAELNKELTTVNSNLERCQFRLKEQVKAIIGTINGFFTALDKRNGFVNLLNKSVIGAGEYRSDGFEQMFFNELAVWISATLPLLPPDRESTIDEVTRRLKYCQDVYSNILVFRHDEGKKNAKNQLHVIIEQLQGVLKDIQKYSQAARFNQMIESIGAELSQMVANTFHICHLISNSEYSKTLVVSEYLHPAIRTDKTTTHLNTLMAQWLINTFNLAGVENNNFSNTKEIDFEQIAAHLKSELPTDIKKLNLESTGLHGFARQTPTAAKIQLERVQAMHRAILHLFHVHKSLVIAAQVVAIYGEIWLYGDDEGKLVLGSLLEVIGNVSAAHMKIVEEFWSNFYGVDATQPKPGSYLAYIKDNHLDNKKEPLFNYLLSADKYYSQIKECHKNIQTKIKEINTASQSFEKEREEAKQKKIELITHLYEYMSKMPGIDASKVAAIKQLWTQIQEERLGKPAASIPLTPAYIAPRPIQLNARHAPIFLKAKELLQEPFDLGITIATDLKPMVKPSQFYSSFHENIYDGFLLPYTDSVNAWIFWSIFRLYGLTKKEMRQFRHAYTCVNSIMKMIYPPEGDGGQQEWNEVKKTELAVVDQYLRNTLSKIYRFFDQKNRGIPQIDYIFELFTVTEIDNENTKLFEITIDPVYLQYASGIYAEKLAALDAELQRTKAESLAYKAKLDESELNLKHLESKLNAIQENYKKQEMALMETTSLLATKEQARTETEKTSEEQQVIIADLRHQAEYRSIRAAASRDKTHSPLSRKKTVVDFRETPVALSEKEFQKTLAEKEQMIDQLRKALEKGAGKSTPKDQRKLEQKILEQTAKIAQLSRELNTQSQQIIAKGGKGPRSLSWFSRGTKSELETQPSTAVASVAESSKPVESGEQDQSPQPPNDALDKIRESYI